MPCEGPLWADSSHAQLRPLVADQGETFPSGTDVSKAQISDFAKSADLTTWQTIYAADAQGRADLRRKCILQPSSNGSDADKAWVIGLTMMMGQVLDRVAEAFAI